jgi:hypothetical protein
VVPVYWHLAFCLNGAEICDQPLHMKEMGFDAILEYLVFTLGEEICLND